MKKLRNKIAHEIRECSHDPLNDWPKLGEAFIERLAEVVAKGLVRDKYISPRKVEKDGKLGGT